VGADPFTQVFREQFRDEVTDASIFGTGPQFQIPVEAFGDPHIERDGRLFLLPGRWFLLLLAGRRPSWSRCWSDRWRRGSWCWRCC